MTLTQARLRAAIYPTRENLQRVADERKALRKVRLEAKMARLQVQSRQCMQGAVR